MCAQIHYKLVDVFHEIISFATTENFHYWNWSGDTIWKSEEETSGKVTCNRVTYNQAVL